VAVSVKGELGAVVQDTDSAVRQPGFKIWL
jgi:hypothetical protein